MDTVNYIPQIILCLHAFSAGSLMYLMWLNWKIRGTRCYVATRDYGM
jgi:hypothetical protein